MPRLTNSEKVIRGLEAERDQVMADATGRIAVLNLAIQKLRDESERQARRRVEKVELEG